MSWSNEDDDGRGVLHGTQHGTTQTIVSCDADDPACRYHVSPEGYPHSYWTGVRPPIKQTVQVQRSNIMPSSWEDDVNEGDGARIARSDEVRTRTLPNISDFRFLLPCTCLLWKSVAPTCEVPTRCRRSRQYHERDVRRYVADVLAQLALCMV